VGYNKIIQYGNTVETYEYRNDYVQRRIKSRTRATRSSGFKIRNRRPDNLFRLKRGFMRLVRANLTREENPILLTLTMFEAVPIGKAYGAFSRFVCLLRGRFGEKFSYIAVPEFQGNRDYYGRYKEAGGAVHFHVISWGLPISPKEERRSRSIQRLWARGYVDVVPTDSSSKLAGYLGKYLFKTMSDDRLLGKKAYVASRNVLRPVQIKAQSSVTRDIISNMVGCASPSVVRYFDTQWLGSCKYTRYVL